MSIESSIEQCAILYCLSASNVCEKKNLIATSFISINSYKSDGKALKTLGLAFCFVHLQYWTSDSDLKELLEMCSIFFALIFTLPQTDLNGEQSELYIYNRPSLLVYTHCSPMKQVIIICIYVHCNSFTESFLHVLWASCSWIKLYMYIIYISINKTNKVDRETASWGISYLLEIAIAIFM